MYKGYINSLDYETAASEYKIIIEYADGKISEKQIVNYSYSNVFTVIEEMHENDKEVRSIKIELIR